MQTDSTTLGVGVAALAVLIVISGVPAPVSAHVNDVGVDAQVSVDGTVVLETVFSGVDGFVVLHEVDGSEPGEPIGHVAVSEEGGLKEDVTLDVADATWQDWTGAREVWAVLHSDDGDGEFEPENDEMLEQFGDPAGDRFTLERGDATAYVTAREFSPQASDDGGVTIRAVTLPDDGHLVLREDTDDGPGAVVGTTALDAGASRNVTVQIDEAFFRDREESFTLFAAAYRDDGNGEFDESDEPVTAGSDPVATRFGVEKTGGSTPTATAGADDTEQYGHGDEDGHDHEHDGSSNGTAGDGFGFSGDDGSGFGPLAALVAVAVVAFGWRRR